MIWFSLSLLTALLVSTEDAWVKRSFSHLSSYEMSAYPLVYSLPLFICAVFFISVPSLDPVFFWYFLIALPLNGVAYLLYIKALKVSPLSLTIPYLAFTPAFTIFTGYIFLDETPTWWSGLGILIVCVGGYILNVNFEKWTFFTPLKAIGKETGSWIMLIVSFLFSFAAVIGKVMIVHSSPLFFAVSFFTGFNVVFLLFLFISGKILPGTFINAPIKGTIAGTLFFFHIFTHVLAISLTKAVYMISIKRLSVLFSIIYGGVIFKEKNLFMRFCGALLMFIGAALILFKGN
ncbi:MAG: EamA family transporter [bacterium]